MTRLLIVWITVALAFASAQPATKARPAASNMMTRALTVADIDLYCTIAAEIRKLTGPMRSGADSDRMFEITKSTVPKHGLTHADYRAVDLRIGQALLAIDAGKQSSNARLKTDCDLVARHRARIDAARAFPK